MIVFRIRTAPDLIDIIFSGFALYKPKWERDDYKNYTIALGIEIYYGNFYKSKFEHPYFIKFDEKSSAPIISVPLLTKYVREHMDYILVRDNGKQSMHKYIYFKFHTRISKLQ